MQLIEKRLPEMQRPREGQQLETFGGRIDLTARSCCVDVRTIHRKMRVYGLDKKNFSGRSRISHFKVGIHRQIDH